MIRMIAAALTAFALMSFSARADDAKPADDAAAPATTKKADKKMEKKAHKKAHKSKKAAAEKTETPAPAK